MMNETNNQTVRNDEVTRAFLDLREGKATSKQELMVFEVCRKTVNILAANYRNSIDRDEFLGNLYLRVLEKKEKYDPEKSAFETWLSWQGRAVRKDLYGRYSNAIKRNAYSLDAYADSDYREVRHEIEDKKVVFPEKKYIFDECIEVINELSKELSDNQRKAIEAIYDRNLKPGEAAEAVGRNSADFYRDHSRALISLRKKLEKYGYSSDDVREML